MPNGQSQRRLPATLTELNDLALDLRWTSSQMTRDIWSRLDPETWERTENPWLILINAHQVLLEKAANDPVLLAKLAHWREKMAEWRACPRWFDAAHSNAGLTRVAYFSMEFGLSESLPIYSGGLGMLAGDHLKSASDLGVPLVGVGLLYQQGYYRQLLAADGSQLEAFPYNEPSSLPITPVVDEDGHRLRIQIELPGRELLVQVWQARICDVTLYLLDTNDPMNGPWDRGITANLYAAGRDKRLLQEIVLGIGGWRLLRQLGIPVDVCHLNEGHAAFAVLARAMDHAEMTGMSLAAAFRATRAGNVFTTHTPVAAAFDEFEPELLSRHARPFTELLGIDVESLLALGRRDPSNTREPFNMAYLAMRGCCHVNGVSKLHGHVSRQLFSGLFPGWPESDIPISSITNGVHIPTWNSLAARDAWHSVHHHDRWLMDLDRAAEAFAEFDLVELWKMRAQARQKLVEYVRRRLLRQLQTAGTAQERLADARHSLDPNVLTLGFARRFTDYKRPNLLLHDPDRLARLLLDRERPVQLIIAGKAHPNDGHGKGLVRAMARFVERPEIRRHAVFLEDYDMVLAQHLAAGVDVWLNTPRRPAEACGTSGMKMLVNGGLNLSVLDGWWDEAWTPDVGWAIGNRSEDDAGLRDAREASEILELLEQQIRSEFYDRNHEGIPERWVTRIRTSMARLTPVFTSHRMVREYVERAYLPASQALRRRTAGGTALAEELLAWHLDLRENKDTVHFGTVTISADDGHWVFDVQAYFGDLRRDAARVELYCDAADGMESKTIPMECDGPIPGAVNGFHHRARVAADRPAEHYTARIVAWHPEASVPNEESFILWQH